MRKCMIVNMFPILVCGIFIFNELDAKEDINKEEVTSNQGTYTEKHNAKFRELLISLAEKDITNKGLSPKTLETMRWVIAEGVRVSPKVKATEANLTRLGRDYSDLLISMVYAEDPQELQAKQLISEIRAALINLSNNKLDRGISKEVLGSSRKKGERYIQDVATVLNEILSNADSIYIPQSLWEQYRTKQIDLTRIGIITPKVAANNLAVWKSFSPSILGKDEHTIAANFVYTRILSSLAIKTYGADRLVNNIFTIPTVDSPLPKEPPYADNMSQLLNELLKFNMLGNDFVYDITILDLFPSWYRVPSTVGNLKAQQPKQKQALKALLDQGSFSKISITKKP